MLHTLLSVFLLFFVVYGIEGGIYPDVIYKPINERFNITCSETRGWGKLNFYDGEEPVDESYLQRFNDTFIQMSCSFARPTRKNYTCKRERSIVGMSEVHIDGPPPKVQEFKCTTSDLTKVLCSFKQTKAILPIVYDYSYAFNNDEQQHLIFEKDGRLGFSTEINVTKFEERLADASLTVIVKAKSEHYDSDKIWYETFQMKLLEILTPKKVRDLRIMSDLTSHNSALVTFALPSNLEHVSQDIIFDIRLRLAEDNAKWMKIQNPRLQLKGNECYLAIDNLDFANTNYTMKVRIKSRSAGDDMWSPFKEISFKTSPKLPETLPETCRNCFNVMDNGRIVAYWMEVPPHYRNADNFSYLVRGWNEHQIEIFNSTQSEASIDLVNTSDIESVRLEIFSMNSVGISKSSSQIFIPLKQLETKKKMLKIRKELNNDSQYKVSWKVLETTDIESFTIIWCHQHSERPNQCGSSVNLQTLSSNTTEFTLEASVLSQFGVAVNHRNKSIIPGFEWSQCTASKPNAIGQVHSMRAVINTEHAITLQWELDCEDEPIVVGYNFTYCLMDESSADSCGEPMQSETLLLTDGQEVFEYEIKGLKSYRFYSISMALLSETRLGFPKHPIIVRTMEGAPTAPRNLRSTKITSHSIDLTWNRPLEVNGEAITYKLWYNDQDIYFNDNSTMNETFVYKLSNLQSFTNYTITVVACTSICSNSSDSLTLRTAIGEPSIMLQPRFKPIADDKMLISWEAPKTKGGNLDYFHLQVVPAIDKSKAKIYKINGRARSCVIRGLLCETTERYLIYIRGVNVEVEETMRLEENLSTDAVDCFAIIEAFQGEPSGYYYGEWSVVNNYPCRTHLSLMVFAFVIIMAVSSLASVFCIFKLYQRYKEMKDINIVLPKGLDLEHPPSPAKESFDGIKDFDLVKDHPLMGVENEELEKFIPSDPVDPQIYRESAKSEIFLPFTCDPKIKEIFYQMPKSAPVTPAKEVSGYSEFKKNSQVDHSSGYMKMYAPQRLRSNTSVEGYLDMTGSPLKKPSLQDSSDEKSTEMKSFSDEAIRKPQIDEMNIQSRQPFKNPPDGPAKIPPHWLTKNPPNNSGYVMNEIKMFIKESEINNNGYIGKRASILMDPSKKRPPVINSSGYVGFQMKSPNERI